MNIARNVDEFVEIMSASITDDSSILLLFQNEKKQRLKQSKAHNENL